MSQDGLIEGVVDYYTAKLDAHGATPEGVDWNGEPSQTVRFDRLLDVVHRDAPFSLIDYGCGYGALVETLAQRGQDFTYQGFDVAPKMVEEARRRHADDPRVSFTSDPERLDRADYTVASGIFNVRLDVSEERWRDYVHETIAAMAALSRRGIAFNALTVHSDPEFMREDLHYADPAALVDHCLRTHSRDVALRHDYELYEFTLLVRLGGRPPVAG